MTLHQHLVTSPTDGAVTFWKSDKTYNLQALQDGLQELGLGHLAPSERTDMACLRDALEAVLKDKPIIRPKKDKSGYSIIRDGEEGQPGDAWGQIRMVAKLTEGGIACDPEEGHLPSILRAFSDAKSLVTGSQVGTCLVDVTKALGGTCLRDSGGIYWLKSSVLERWIAVANAVANAASNYGKSVVYLIRHPLDKDSAKAVLDSIVAESQKELDQINRDLANPELGERAILFRKEAARELLMKVQEYEEILGVSLESIKRAAAEVETTEAHAALAASCAAGAEALAAGV